MRIPDAADEDRIDGYKNILMSCQLVMIFILFYDRI